MTVAEERSETTYISYAEFGKRFFAYGVSEERMSAAFGKLTGSDFDFGPLGAGPGKVAKVSAKVQLGELGLARTEGEEITFELAIPLKITLYVDLAIDKHRYDVTGTVHLHLTARAAEPLRVIIDVADPRPDDVHIDVSTGTLRGNVLRVVASVDHEIKRFIAKYIGREIRKEHIAKARNIDVGERLDAAWSHSGV